ncbi:hypothetical protein O4J56_20165 [Nocardiopsis sp. RSe5-2]|uniref:Integral membrane protein n=1 Tax=Nocardiopsis endophytica TaxID=3018445 RepID=A0ABT4U7R4_9ACTN|nr:hypothetical protein [Nocardiopsis endophytica]MDA2812971.1 hypothetical protein [Nocardiopsis endophytica]
MDATGPVDAYIAELGGRLKGPLLWRRRVLEETRDGLLCLAEDLAGDHPDREGAERAAVREWGPAAALAEEFSRVAADMRAVSVAVRVLVSVPLLGGLWTVAWLLAPVDPWDGAPGPMDTVQDLLAVATGIALAMSAVTALRNRRSAARGLPLPKGEAVGGGLALLVAIAATLLFLAVRVADSVQAVEWWTGSAAFAATLAVAAVTARDMWCLTVRTRWA